MSSVSNGLYFLTLLVVSIMRVIYRKIRHARYLYIKRNVEKVWGARYTLGERYLSKNTVINSLLPIASGPSLDTRAKFLTLNRTHSRAVTGLLTGHNTLRRHLYLLGLLDSPLCRKCAVREETSAHILYECEALASLRHAYLGSFILEPEDVKSLGLGAICNFSKVTGLP